MRQRVVAAMGLTTYPELSIADEPTRSLDVTIQAQFLRFIKELQREKGTSVIWVTHDLGTVAQMCDLVNVMYAGRIVESAPVRKIYKEPQRPCTKALLDSVPIKGVKRDRLSQKTCAASPPVALSGHDVPQRWISATRNIPAEPP